MPKPDWRNRKHDHHFRICLDVIFCFLFEGKLQTKFTTAFLTKLVSKVFSLPLLLRIPVINNQRINWQVFATIG
ncbi:hypothetical protein CLV75_1661 [Ruegeria conchae]|uniref:Uncharacterized protein n=1 Tax=Ruegeria conchae TaxID=981384 RepID=A0A497ZMU3_9RHOB|nr:hypothetical protein CLV75_1661 [Ruegeria conchae]